MTTLSDPASDLTDLIAKLEKAEVGSRELREDIERQVEFDPFGGCWLWAGRYYFDKAKRRPKIYATVAGKQWLAHRAAFYAYDGRHPGPGYVCHTCDNPWCVNPGHLYLGDHISNMRDMSERKRTFAHRQPERVRQIAARLGRANTWTQGEKNPKARLSADLAAQIREATGANIEIAERFNVSPSLVGRIRLGRLWKDADGPRHESYPLTERDIALLSKLASLGPDAAWRMQDVGGTTESYHSATARKLKRRGLVQSVRRSAENQTRPSALYQITEAGIAFLRAKAQETVG